MLKLLREQFRNLKWILWALVVMFIFWGIYWGSSGLRQSESPMAGIAAKVGNGEIHEQDFLREMHATEQRYRQMYGEQFEKVRNQLDLGTITLQTMVDRYLLMGQARRMGIEVTDKELLEKITSLGAFHRSDGSFVGEELYQQILRANQMTAEDFEASLRQDMMMGKLEEALTAGIIIPDSEVEQLYRQRNESATFELIWLPVDRALGEVTVTDAEAKAYYDAHQASFSHPEQRQLRYLLVDEAKVRRALTLPENQITDYYSSHQSEFQAGEQLHARHILITPKVKDDAGWAAALERTREAWKKASAPGADFGAIAKQYSDDPGSKGGGGDLGWFGRGRMVKEFEDAAYALRPGGVSGPVKTQFGYHVIKLEERRPASVKPLAEVHDQIKDKLVEGQADAEGNRRAAALREKVDAAKLVTDDQWRALATDVVTSNVTPYFAQGDVIPGLGRDPELIAEAMNAKEAFIGGPRRSARGWIVYRVGKIRAAGTTPFDEAKEEARDGAKREKAVARLAQTLEAKRPALVTASLKDQAPAVGGAFQEVKEHHRDSAIPGLGVAKTLEDAVFTTPAGALTPVVKVGERGAAIARVVTVKLMDPGAFAKEKAALRDSMVKTEVQRLLTAMRDEAKRENPVVPNTELLDRFKPKRG
jgi:peptidyl-prolyl cis-trans isomerase D